MNISDLLEEQARLRNKEVAIISAKESCTFGELLKASQEGAAFLSSLQIKKGDFVLVFVPMSIELYEVLFSIWRIGAIAMFIDPSVGKDTIQKCCQRIQAKAFVGGFVGQMFRLMIPALKNIPLSINMGSFIFANKWSTKNKFSIHQIKDVPKIELSDPALITFTSGSTGLPKVAVRTHEFLISQYEVLKDTLHLVPKETNLATLPIFALVNLAAGVTTLIPDANLRKPGHIKPDPVFRQMKRLCPTTAVGSPAFFERLLTSPNCHQLQNLTHLYTGGAPVYPSLLKRLQKMMPKSNVVAVYGSTEAEPIAEFIFGHIENKIIEDMQTGKGLYAGKIVEKIECKILNFFKYKIKPVCTAEELDAICSPINEPGEIVVSGKHVLSGYLNGEGDEENKIKVNGQVWHRTGDVGKFDDKRHLWLLGRCSAVVNDEYGILFPFAVEVAIKESFTLKNVALCTYEGKRLLVVEGSDDIEKNIAFQKMKDNFSIHQIVHMSIPLDKRHNAKVDYGELNKLLKQMKK